MPKALSYDYLIAGGGVAGVTAAEEIRRRDPRGNILIISKETDPLYSRVLLPHYLRGRIKREKVFLRAFSHYEEAGIDVWPGEHIVSANLQTREVLTSGSRNVTYKKLLIATGGEVHPLRLPGAGTNEHIFRLQSLADADRTRSYFQEVAGTPKNSGLIIGSSFIGLEFIETAAAYKIPAELLLRDQKYFGEALDDAGWEMLKNNFARHGIIVCEDTEPKRILEKEGNLVIEVANGKSHSGSWLALGIGLEKNFAPFEGTGLLVERGIKTNQLLETSVKDVWAAGDVVEFYDVIFDEYRVVGNWTSAVLQGKVAGANMAGAKEELRSVSAYSITNLGFHITIVGQARLNPEMTDIVRVWPEVPAYERLFFDHCIVKGALLINRFQDKAALARLIEERRDLSSFMEELKNPNAEISSLV